MVSEQIKISDIFNITPDYIDAESPEKYLCEKIKLDNGRQIITIREKESLELLYEEFIME